MNRKWVGAATAVALAAIGTWVLVAYVRGAENRALEGQETVTVLVADSMIPAGSVAEDIGGSVRIETVPARVQVPGSLADLDALRELGGRVTSVDLLPGEQVLMNRFIEPADYEEQGRTAVPDGMVEVSISLTPERAVGGSVRPGGIVDVVASFGEQTVEPRLAGTDGATQQVGEAAQLQSSTHIILENVLISNVQVEELPRADIPSVGDGPSLALAPAGQFLVTLAMEPADAERFIYTAEFGSVWLADSTRSPDGARTAIQDRTTVYEDTGTGR